jgi:hypothetical protein
MDTQIQTPTKQINYSKEPNKAHKNTLKVINENFIEILLDMVKQNVQEALKKFKTTKIKNIKNKQIS